MSGRVQGAGRSVVDFTKLQPPTPNGTYQSTASDPLGLGVPLSDKIDLLQTECARLKIDDRIVDWDTSLWHTEMESLLSHVRRGRGATAVSLYRADDERHRKCRGGNAGAQFWRARLLPPRWSGGLGSTRVIARLRLADCGGSLAITHGAELSLGCDGCTVGAGSDDFANSRVDWPSAWSSTEFSVMSAIMRARVLSHRRCLGRINTALICSILPSIQPGPRNFPATPLMMTARRRSASI